MLFDFNGFMHESLPKQLFEYGEDGDDDDIQFAHFSPIFGEIPNDF